jgi:hypothetical protein
MTGFDLSPMAENVYDEAIVEVVPANQMISEGVIVKVRLPLSFCLSPFAAPTSLLRLSLSSRVVFT